MFRMVGNCSSILLLLIYHMNLEGDRSKGKQEGKHYLFENRALLVPRVNIYFLSI